MSNDLAVLETQLKPLVPSLAQALAGRFPVERLTRTVIVAAEKTPKLLQCTRQSLFNAAMSAAVLGLEVDGVTGQAFLIPYGTNAQLVIGYKGMNTLGARSGYTITAGTVCESDEFDFEQGSRAFVHHKFKLGNRGRTIGFWACGASKSLPPIVSILPLDDALAIKAKSPGAKKSDSPWNDPVIGFAAMGEKSARRRLARSMPLNVETRDYHLAARMGEAFEEQGKLANVRSDGTLIVEGEFTPLPQTQSSDTPAMSEIVSPKPTAASERMREAGRAAAARGESALKVWWLSEEMVPWQKELTAFKDSLKPIAAEADEQLNKGSEAL